MTVGTKNLLEVLTAGRELPPECDKWVIRSTKPDITSKHGYQWPFPGNWALAGGPIFDTNTTGCPTHPGDGICVATTWAGMAAGGYPARTLLLCAINSADIIGREGPV